jgi:DNA-directed RNA polymerase subunit omega
MLYPSIDNLLSKVDSKYKLVTISSKRARELLQKPESVMVERPRSDKSVGKALEEIFEEKLILVEEK